MGNIAQILQAPPPRSITAARQAFPQHDAVHASPHDWRDEVLYFLLPDRFSDGQDHTRPLLDRARLGEQRAAFAAANGLPAWRWDTWRQSGEGRFQGGTLAGIKAGLRPRQEVFVANRASGSYAEPPLDSSELHKAGDY